jgi:putative intracellular protease/amidase
MARSFSAQPVSSAIDRSALNRSRHPISPETYAPPRENPRRLRVLECRHASLRLRENFGVEEGENMKIVMVLTSHDQLGNTGRKTGFWLEEFAAPYFVFRDAGVDLTLASPKGGQPPIDPKSDLPENQTPAMARFKQDAAAKKALAGTVKLADVKAQNYDSVFYVGGHGPMWDLAENPTSIALLESFYDSGKPIALVCHSPGVLRRVKSKGAPLVKGKRVTGFSNGEEEAVQLTKVVPFLVEDELKRLGAKYEKVANWQPFSVVDGRLVTGQNPASSTGAAQALLKLLGMQLGAESAASV